MKNIQDLTDQELQSRKKSSIVILGVATALIIGYGVYFVWSLATNNWSTNNTLGVSGLGLLIILIANVSVRSAAVTKEIKRRQE